MYLKDIIYNYPSRTKSPVQGVSVVRVASLLWTGFLFRGQMEKLLIDICGKVFAIILSVSYVSMMGYYIFSYRDWKKYPELHRLWNFTFYLSLIASPIIIAMVYFAWKG